MRIVGISGTLAAGLWSIVVAGADEADGSDRQIVTFGARPRCQTLAESAGKFVSINFAATIFINQSSR